MKKTLLLLVALAVLSAGSAWPQTRQERLRDHVYYLAADSLRGRLAGSADATKAAEPEELEEVELTLDRPFLFVVTNAEGLPLFVGICNSPTP